MFSFLDIIIYMTAVLICYKLRVYISFLWNNKNDNKDVKQTNDIDIVIFFPSDNVLKNSKNSAKNEKCYPLNTLLSVIKSAQKSLDICVYALSLAKVIKQCIRLHKNGVKIRIIINKLQIRTDNISFAYKLTNDILIQKRAIQLLKDAGIEVRSFDMRIGYMHNKFALVDNTILINGSFNWTKKGTKVNFEDLVITSEPKLVSIYSGKFNEFWTQSEKDFHFIDDWQ